MIMSHIYLDLDGVLVNLYDSFHLYYDDKSPSESWQDYETKKLKTSIFKKIYEDTDPYDFWVNLEPLPEYMELVNYTVKLIGEENISILSAPTKDFTKECSLGKIDWVRKNIPYNFNVNVVRRENKKAFSGRNQILIDDLSTNIVEWTTAGGVGILHINNTITFEHLNRIFNK